MVEAGGTDARLERLLPSPERTHNRQIAPANLRLAFLACHANYAMLESRRASAPTSSTAFRRRKKSRRERTLKKGGFGPPSSSPALSATFSQNTRDL